MSRIPLIPANYAAFLEALKARIQSARQRATAAANRELMSPLL